MFISIVIPAHNEERFLAQCLDSFVYQTRIPDQLIIVDDNSTDNTKTIAQSYADKHPWITVVTNCSNTKHLPGKKVINAFNFGFTYVSEDYDLIGKFDADIILPDAYFEAMENRFNSDWLLGMCSGLLYVEKDGDWVYENIAKKSHIRGPIKLYYREVFELMGGLRPDVGWDTVDVLLCQYHDFKVTTDPFQKVKHLRPTGADYNQKTFYDKGKALYNMRYGLPLAKIALLKMAITNKNLHLYLQGILGYVTQWIQRAPRMVTKDEGKFIRRLRWQGIFKALGS